MDLLKHINFMRLLDTLMTFCAINDGNQLLTSFKNIYPKDLELKVELQGNHVSFIDLDIKIEDSAVVFKLLGKREKFPYFIARMPHFSSNIRKTVYKIIKCT